VPALAVLSKLFPAIVLPLFVVAGRWRVVPWTLGAAALLVAASLPLTGIADYLRHPGYLSTTFYLGAGSDGAHNFSFKHSLHRCLEGPQGETGWRTSAATGACALRSPGSAGASGSSAVEAGATPRGPGCISWRLAGRSSC